MYLTDPKTNQKSVTLTFLVISFMLLVGFSAAGALDYVTNINSLSELFYACSALYFGRRVEVGNKTFNAATRTRRKK